MFFSGNSISIEMLEGSIAHLVFDLQDASVNKLSRAVILELEEAISRVEENNAIQALIISSSKDVFIVGADVTEFLNYFLLPGKELLQWVENVQTLFCRIEDLPIPTVTTINGYALGGGCELALSTDYRVMADTARIGLPEVKLGIFPGWGGTVRLPRLIGADNAMEWICNGGEKKADEAFAQHAVDSVVSQNHLHEAALRIIDQCLRGKLDYQARKKEKRQPLKLNQIEGILTFESAKAIVMSEATRHFPAPIAAVETIQHHATMFRDDAMNIEANNFVSIAKTKVARNLVGLFLNDQRVKKASKLITKNAREVKRAAVLGAGIMGGGIAYQSACKNIPILMKDIEPEALQLGLDEASKLLMKQVKRGRLTTKQVLLILNKINTSLSYSDFNTADLVVEAVVENEAIKSSVLVETEEYVREDCVITSNTSTISITKLSASLKIPERFCGMHFFNPVYRMPLVEVIRGEKSNDIAIATTVSYARAMGKTPIVVNDCPGFFVNRVLFPYLAGFDALVRDGVDFARIDKVMEKFGWPMGPALLLDIVGIDTAHHASEVMAKGYPNRMNKEFKTATDLMYENNRLGQKNKNGFYKYENDKKGKLKKLIDKSASKLLHDVRTNNIEVSNEEIINRMMIPMCMETVRCIDDGVVDNPLDADIGLILGIAFPSFRGGALRYIDDIGVKNFYDIALQYAHINPTYSPTESIERMAKNNDKFYTGNT